MIWFRSAPPALALDFIPHRHRPTPLGWLILLAAVLVAAAVTLEALDVQERLDEAQQQLARAQRSQQRAIGSQQTRKQIGAQDKAADIELRRATNLAAHLAVNLQSPWLQLMPQLEAAGHGDIALLALDADTAKAQINVAGEARSLEAVFAYARRIGEQPGFSSVQVQNYEFQKKGLQDVVQFKLSARWRSEA